MYGSTELTKYGKATLTPQPQAPPCDKVQIFVLNFLATMLTEFTDKVAIAFRDLIIESDHANGDTSLYAIEQCKVASEEYLRKLATFSGMVIRDGKHPRKDTYYEVMFSAMEEIVPAMRNVESTFGEKVRLGSGISFSNMVRALVQNA